MEAKTILNNRYQVLHKIGSGGMAQVYEARDLYLSRNVAIKINNLDIKIDDLNQQRFLQEIKAVTRVRHPNVIVVYDIFIDQKNWCLVLELLKGKTLKEHLNNVGVLSINETLNIFQKILAGIGACHKSGVIHRDLKPDNILIANNGAIKVLDFGISMIDGYEVKKHHHQVIGTMKYIAPEVVKFENPSPKSDIYSLGILLYEMLCGKPPFYHKNPQLLANKHIKESIPAIKDINPLVTDELEDLIAKATNKNPLKRFQTIEEMELALNGCLSYEVKSPTQLIPLLSNSMKKSSSDKGILPDNHPFFLKKWFLLLMIVIIILIVGLSVLVLIE